LFYPSSPPVALVSAGGGSFACSSSPPSNRRHHHQHQNRHKQQQQQQQQQWQPPHGQMRVPGMLAAQQREITGGLPDPGSGAPGALSGVFATPGQDVGVVGGGWGTGTCDSNEFGSTLQDAPLSSLDALTASISAAAARAAASTVVENHAVGGGREVQAEKHPQAQQQQQPHQWHQVRVAQRQLRLFLSVCCRASTCSPRTRRRPAEARAGEQRPHQQQQQRQQQLKHVAP
ncbi:hypothetical protein CLOP_g23573, partial [Closterium sp. NIES-67]